MAKGKKGKKKGKKKEVKPEGALTEVDRTFYELTITDLNRKLARLRATNIELEEKNLELNDGLTKLDDDRNDVIIYLKRILQERSEEIAELQSATQKLQETLEQTKQENSVNVEQMENEYKQMHEQLTSEIKLLEGKLNALEEFRLQREELMRKFEVQEDKIEEQEEIHKKAIYEIERKFIIAKDKLKKEMEARLLQLSTEFQDATEIRIAATTHRVIRENIAINNELDEMLGVHKRLYNENQEMKRRDKTLRQQVELYSTEKNMALGKARVQGKVIEQLTNQHESISKQVEHYKQIEREMHETREESHKMSLKVSSLENQIRVLEQNLHAAKCCVTEVKNVSNYYQTEAKRLEAILLEAVGSIKEVTRIIKTQRITDKATLANKRENLLANLFKLLITAKDAKINVDSISSVSSIESIYKRGDLGFVPPSGKELRPRARGRRTMEAQTGSSLDEDIESVKKVFEKSASRQDADLEDKDEENLEESVQSDVYFKETESSEEEEGAEESDVEEVENEVEPNPEANLSASVPVLPLSESKNEMK